MVLKFRVNRTFFCYKIRGCFEFCMKRMNNNNKRVIVGFKGLFCIYYFEFSVLRNFLRILRVRCYDFIYRYEY